MYLLCTQAIITVHGAVSRISDIASKMAAAAGGAGGAALPRAISATFSAPSNIAVIKYWGKRDEVVNLPINSSLSCTINQDDLKALTTVVASPAFEKDRLWLNGTEEDISRSKRVQAVLREIRARAGSRSDDAGAAVPAAELASWKVHIVSRNTFPTAAGLASSAAGYACLVSVLAEVFAVKESYAGELTAIARQGSGSACRSLFGGCVRWEMGAAADGKDSIAVQVADEKHWPELAVLIAVVSDKKKDTGSTEGMRTSVETSSLLPHRAAVVVPERLKAIEAAYAARDFETFARITMQDSNQFHAACLDTFPPIFYMNDTSRRIIGLVHAFNEAKGRIAAGYTFDAGPNAVIYTTKDVIAELLSVLLAHFPDPRTVAPAALPAGYTPYAADSTYVSDARIEAEAVAAVPGLTGKLACAKGAEAPGSVRYFYCTSVGDGPRRLPAGEALADAATGLPLAAAAAPAGDFERSL